MVINLTSKVGALVLVRTRGYEYSRLPSLWIAGGGGERRLRFGLLMGKSY